MDRSLKEDRVKKRNQLRALWATRIVRSSTKIDPGNVQGLTRWKGDRDRASLGDLEDLEVVVKDRRREREEEEAGEEEEEEVEDAGEAAAAVASTAILDMLGRRGARKAMVMERGS